MSLKTRLRMFIIVLMISIVSALSALHLYSLTIASFQDVLARAEMSAQQVKSFLQQRINASMAEQEPQARALDEWTRLWTAMVETDAELTLVLENALTNSKVIVEVVVADQNGQILAASTPARVGERATSPPDFAQWAKRGPWGKLFEIFTERRDYVISVPLGIRGSPLTIFTVKVVISSVLLRDMVFPQIRNIALIFLGALLLSMLLAVVVSNLALRPLHNIGRIIDRISRGELAKQPVGPDSGAKEFAAVQSKLNMLGQQYHGARQDALQLRSNVEQLLEKLEEVVFLFDGDDRLIMAGREADRILLRGRWEIMGRAMTEVFPADSPLGAVVRIAVDLRQPLRNHAITLERDGSPPVRLLVNVELLESFPERKRIGTLVTLRDAETRRQIQSQLDVSARLAAISRLTGGVAHEIKNPLQAITVHLEVLKSKLAAEFDSIGPEIETISREIQRLDRVVKTFLDFTRPIDLKMREIDLSDLAREIAALVGPSAARQNVAIDLAAEQLEMLVRADRDLLKQAILNVVNNGIDAMKNGGSLAIRTRQAGEECELSVADEGSGIPPADRDKIFDLYFSTKGKGSGIGLAMTFRVVQLHNGTIDFTSEPGKGTTFRLRFPAIVREPFGAAYTAASENTRAERMA